MTKIHFDFETQSAAELKKTGAYEYSIDPSTRALCLRIKSPGRLIAFLKYEHLQIPYNKLSASFREKFENCVNNIDSFRAHNAFFEQCIYNNILVRRLGWPEIPAKVWACTAAKAAAVAIPRNLNDAGLVMDIKIKKDFEGHRVMMKLCKPTGAWARWKKELEKHQARGNDGAVDQLYSEQPPQFWTPETAPEDFAKLYAYCIQDVDAEENLDQVLPELTPKEQAVWLLDQKINFRGVAVDMPLVQKITNIMKAESKTMAKTLDIVTMGLVSSGNARNQILEFLDLEGITLPDLKAKTVDDFLKNGKATGDAKTLLEIRRALSKASTAKYNKFLMCAKSDGRVRDLFLYCGASTGRWGGKNVQPQNFPRGIIKDIDDAINNINTLEVADLKLLYGDNLMPLFSSVLRGMFIASKGHELFVQDWNAIETRVLFWLSGHEAGLDMFRNGQDPYRDQASDIFKKSPLDISDDERQVGKAAVLGCGYQMGPKKFMTAAWDVYRAKVSLDLAKIAVTSYRTKHFPVTEVWENYFKAACFAVENPSKRYTAGKCFFYMFESFLMIELPSGRRLAYKDPSVVFEDVHIKNDDGEIVNKFMTKKLKYFAINHKAKRTETVIPKWSLETTYGGKITENIVQAVSRDLLAFAMVNAEKAGFKVLMHAHDELVCEALIGEKTSDDYKNIMEKIPLWAEGLPLKASGWTGFRYKKG